MDQHDDPSGGPKAAYSEQIAPYEGPNLSSRFAADAKISDSVRNAELKFLVDNYRAIQWSQYQAWRTNRGR
ncbi:MAG: hypothetical protein ABWZ40_01875 [Caulobacterales bacterium]